MSKYDMEIIYNSYFKKVFGYVLSLCQNIDLAEELTQDTFYKAIKGINNFRGECEISTWLCQIAKYTWYQYLDKKNHYKEENINIEIIDSYNVEQDIINKDEKIKVFKEINKLDEITKVIFLMHLTGELTFKEIGEIYGKSENWARVKYYRSKIKVVEEKGNGKLE